MRGVLHLPRPPFPCPFFGAFSRSHHRSDVIGLAVLAVELDVARGFLQKPELISTRPFLPPKRSRWNLVTGTSGTASKVLRSAPLTESVLPASSISIGWRGGALEADHQVGQLVGGRSAGRRCRQRVVEQRRGRRGLAVDRAGRAGVGGELDPGADPVDVGVVEEGRFRQLDLGAGDVGVAGPGGQGCLRLGWARRLTLPLSASFRLGLEAELLAAADLEAAGRRGGGAVDAGDRRR